MVDLPKLVDGMHGLGDNIYQRAFVSQLEGDVYIKTPWPDIYSDLPVMPVRTHSKLRTQKKNETLRRGDYYDAPEFFQRFRIGYGDRELSKGSIIDAMKYQFGVYRPVFDLPLFPLSPREIERPFALIRPVTVRSEWRSDSRNPDPRYVFAASAELMKHFYVISVADLMPGAEWLVGVPPPAHCRYHHGELSISELLALVRYASVVITPVGWAVPAAIAYHTPLFVIAGGRGGHNAPSVITSAEMDLSRVGWGVPDNYCMCKQWDHDCDKNISYFPRRFKEWLNAVVL